MPEITSITSEELQAQIRRLLPSQRGFGNDLEAINVVQPVIDLTPSAEGSQLPAELQRAWDFSITSVSVTNTTTSFITTPGFWKVWGTFGGTQTAGVQDNKLLISNGFTNKALWAASPDTAASDVFIQVPETTIFLRAGDSLSVQASVNCQMVFAARQVATVTGDFVNPNDFSFE